MGTAIGWWRSRDRQYSAYKHFEGGPAAKGTMRYAFVKISQSLRLYRRSAARYAAPSLVAQKDSAQSFNEVRLSISASGPKQSQLHWVHLLKRLPNFGEHIPPTRRSAGK